MIVDCELERMPALELIATRSTGYDHIDADACMRRGIAIANVPTYGENTVAEHAFAMILALSRRLLEAERRGRRGAFDLESLQGFDRKGKTLGIVGAWNRGGPLNLVVPPPGKARSGAAAG